MTRANREVSAIGFGFDPADPLADIPSDTTPELFRSPDFFKSRMQGFADFLRWRVGVNETSRGDILTTSPRVLFILRTKTTRSLTRGILNEDDVVAALESSGDINLRLGRFSNLPMANQIEEAANAHIIMGVHGAGLTHAMHLNGKQTALIQFVVLGFHSGAERYFHRIAAAVGANYVECVYVGSGVAPSAYRAFLEPELPTNDISWKAPQPLRCQFWDADQRIVHSEKFKSISHESGTSPDNLRLDPDAVLAIVKRTLDIMRRGL